MIKVSESLNNRRISNAAFSDGFLCTVLCHGVYGRSGPAASEYEGPEQTPTSAVALSVSLPLRSRHTACLLLPAEPAGRSLYLVYLDEPPSYYRYQHRPLCRHHCADATRVPAFDPARGFSRSGGDSCCPGYHYEPGQYGDDPDFRPATGSMEHGGTDSCRPGRRG